jgi:hypothetical protein
MTDATKKSQDRRALAAVYLKDSSYEGSSWRSRADCAVDAVYLYALVVLGADADRYEHPDAKALTDAAAVLGWSAAKMTPAVVQLGRRYAPFISPQEAHAAYEKLVSLAMELGVGT